MQSSFTSNFKRSVIPSVLFLLILLGLLLSASFFQRQFLRNKFSGKALFLGAEKSVLLSGNSVFVLGIDPSTDNAWVNIGQLGEPLLGSKYKIKAYLESNPQIETICLAFTPLNVTSRAEDNFFKNAAVEYYNRYYCLFDMSGCKYAMGNPSLGIRYFLAYKLGLPIEWDRRTFLFLIRNKELPFIGGHQPHNDRNPKPDTLKIAVENFFYERDGRLKMVSSWQVNSLYDICEITSKAGINLVLINMPTEPELYDQFPHSVMDVYHQCIENIHKKYPSVVYFDAHGLFSDRADSTSLFYDESHLNSKGASAFSRDLNAKIEK